MLLAEVATALWAAGYPVLASTFTVNNEQSMRRHWRAGFVMPPSPWHGPVAERVDPGPRPA